MEFSLSKTAIVLLAVTALGAFDLSQRSTGKRVHYLFACIFASAISLGLIRATHLFLEGSFASNPTVAALSVLFLFFLYRSLFGPWEAETKATVLGTFLFQNDTVYKKVAVLSGGEKSRLALVKILLDPPNVLLLDEPTTHLDMASVDTLVEALKEFEGTVGFISHDLYFVNALADHVVHVKQGQVSLYHGNYDYFQRRQAHPFPDDPVPVLSPRQPAQAGPVSGGAKSSTDDIQRLRVAEKARSKTRKKLNARLREIEDELEDLTARLGSVFIQSDYQKLMELDLAVKALQEERTTIQVNLVS
jgi:ABC-type multidrug transport system ATPase subunit